MSTLNIFTQMSVRGRLFTIMLTLVLLTELGSGLAFQSHLSSWLFNEVIKRHSKAATEIAQELKQVPLEPHLLSQQLWLVRVAATLGARLSVISKEGTLLFDSTLATERWRTPPLHQVRPEVQQILQGAKNGHARRHSTTVHTDLIYVTSAIADGQGNLKGVVRLAHPAARLDTQLKHLNQVLWSILFGSLLLALIISGWATRILSQTLRRLVTLARELVEGDPSRELTIEGRDEYSKLARSLTTLSQQIEQHVSHLAESRDRFEAVLDAMREGVIALDSDHRISLANRSACRLLGWASPPLGEQIDECIAEEALSHFLRERVAEDEPWVELEFQGRRTLLARLTRQSTVGEEVLVLSDITALRRLETVRRDFVANVSHELRTPTTVIQANAETLLDGAMDDPEFARSFLEGIDRNAQRLAHLVSDLLDLSRIESGTYRLQSEQVDLSSLVASVVDTLADQIIAKRIKVKIKVSKEHRLHTDLGALEQVFTNLIENAVNYTQGGGKVTIKAKPVPETDSSRSLIRFEVIDNGPGIAAQHKERIFERFYRVDKGRSRHLGGTGLGLAIVKHLCNALGGEVGVKSQEGTGCTFWFTLPSQEQSSEV